MKILVGLSYALLISFLTSVIIFGGLYLAPKPIKQKVLGLNDTLPIPQESSTLLTDSPVVNFPPSTITQIQKSVYILPVSLDVQGVDLTILTYVFRGKVASFEPGQNRLNFILPTGFPLTFNLTPDTIIDGTSYAGSAQPNQLTLGQSISVEYIYDLKTKRSVIKRIETNPR